MDMSLEDKCIQQQLGLGGDWSLPPPLHYSLHCNEYGKRQDISSVNKAYETNTRSQIKHPQEGLISK